MFTGIIRTIITTKFQVNLLTVSLFSGSGPKSLPPPVAGEISKAVGYRVNRQSQVYFYGTRGITFMTIY